MDDYENLNCPICGQKIGLHTNSPFGYNPKIDRGAGEQKVECPRSHYSLIEEALKEKIKLETWKNKELQYRINEMVNDLRAITNSENLTSDELRKLALLCLLRKGFITNDNRIV
jgi:hypothetical protein